MSIIVRTKYWREESWEERERGRESWGRGRKESREGGKKKRRQRYSKSEDGHSQAFRPLD